jgi:hypothetical protein
MTAACANDPSPMPTALVGDLDRDQDEEEWELRVMKLPSVRIHAARTRLERMGIIDASGHVVSSELPPT